MPTTVSAQARSILRRVRGLAGARRRLNREASSDRGPRAEELRAEYDRIAETDRAEFIGECISTVASYLASLVSSLDLSLPTRLILSESTNGRPIPVAATATPGTSLHVTVSGTSGYDEIWLFASNVTAASATLTIEFGAAADPGGHLVKNYSIAPNSSPIPICLGSTMNNGLAVRAFSGTSAAINITGYVNRFSL